MLQDLTKPIARETLLLVRWSGRQVFQQQQSVRREEDPWHRQVRTPGQFRQHPAFEAQSVAEILLSRSGQLGGTEVGAVRSDFRNHTITVVEVDLHHLAD